MFLLHFWEMDLFGLLLDNIVSVDGVLGVNGNILSIPLQRVVSITLVQGEHILLLPFLFNELSKEHILFFSDARQI